MYNGIKYLYRILGSEDYISEIKYFYNIDKVV